MCAGVGLDYLVKLACAAEQVCPETLPRSFRERYELAGLHQALQNVHFPESLEALREARRRLAFEEMLIYMMSVSLSRHRSEPGFPLPVAKEDPEAFWRQMPFPPTGAQRRVLEEIAADYTYDPELAMELLAGAGFDASNPLTFDIVCDPLTDMDLYVLVQSYLAAVGVTMNIVPVPEVMEHNSIVKDETDARAFNAFAGNFSSINDAYGMTVTGGFGSGYFHNDELGQEYDDLYQQLTAAPDMESAAEIARQMDTIWLSQHWCITFGGAPQCSEFMSGRIGGFTGENIYNNNSMHTIFARLWVEE